MLLLFLCVSTGSRDYALVQYSDTERQLTLKAISF